MGRTAEETPLLRKESSQSRASFPVTAKDLAAIAEVGKEESSKKIIQRKFGSLVKLSEILRTDLERGLSTKDLSDLRSREKAFGRNKLEEKSSKNIFQLMWDALQDPTLIVLCISGVLSLILGIREQHAAGPRKGEEEKNGWIEGASILLAVAVVVVVTAVNDYQKEKQFRALNNVKNNEMIKIIRNGEADTISIYDILVGDIVRLEVGDLVPADGIIIEASDLRVDESSLTGETDLIKKDQEENLLCLSGCKVMEGSAKMLIIAVGENSQSGLISALIAEGKAPQGEDDGQQKEAKDIDSMERGEAGAHSDQERTEENDHQDPMESQTVLQSKLEHVAVRIGQFGTVVAILTFLGLAGRHCITKFYVNGQSWDESDLGLLTEYFIQGVTVLVVAVPEGLPLATTISLAFSVKKMLKDNNLVRHLSACETMGSATTICCDKTGTLTTNRMTVTALWAGETKMISEGSSGTWRTLAKQGEASKAGHVEHDEHKDLYPTSPDGDDDESLEDSPLLSSVDGGDEQKGQISNKSRNKRSKSTKNRSRQSTNTGKVDRGFPNKTNGTGELVRSNEGNQLSNPMLRKIAEISSINSTAEMKIKDVPDQADSEKRNSQRDAKSHKDGATAANGGLKGEVSPYSQVEFTGSKTECALLKLSKDLGFNYQAVRKSCTVLKTLTFSSARKRMSTFVTAPQYSHDGHPEEVQKGSSMKEKKKSNKNVLYSKGAPEIMLGLCSKWMRADGSIEDLSEERKSEIKESAIDNFAAQGLRTLGLCYKEYPSSTTTVSLDDETDFILVCIAGIEDPVRDEVPGAIKQCQGAGIVVRMCTGDNVKTATSVARKCGILPPLGDAPLPSSSLCIPPPSAAISKLEASGPSASVQFASQPPPGSDQPQAGTLVMEGPQFRSIVLDENGELIQEKFDAIWPSLRVLARSSPKDKFVLVSGLMKSKLNPHREVVAVTGDGTNDGPALKWADVGFAMGITGTSVAKDASDIILMDDNFNSIVQAVKWGRNVYDSIAKFLQFQLTVNAVAVIVALGCSILLDNSPLTATQMLWINLIMDSLASLALATEPPNQSLLKRAPYGSERPIVSRKMLFTIVSVSLYQLVLLYLLVFLGDSFFDIGSGRDEGPRSPATVHYTIVFNAFVVMTLVNQINCRKVHNEVNIFEGITANRLFIVIMVLETLGQVVIVQFGGSFVKCHPLTLGQWAWCILFGLLELPYVFFVHQAEKYLPAWLQKSSSETKALAQQQEKERQERARSEASASSTPQRRETSSSFTFPLTGETRTKWFRGMRRLRTQIQIIHAFQASGRERRRRLSTLIE